MSRIASHMRNQSTSLLFGCTVEKNEAHPTCNWSAPQSSIRKEAGQMPNRNSSALLRETTTAEDRETTEYVIWMGIKQRCHCQTSKHYRTYGARGITVCKEWRASFHAFLADVGKRPSSKHSLDRINNEGNYEPSNCRWATNVEQARNTSRNRILTAFGESLCLKEWSEKTGINVGAIEARLRNKWPIEEVLTLPVDGSRADWARLVAYSECARIADATAGGEFAAKAIREAAKSFGKALRGRAEDAA